MFRLPAPLEATGRMARSLPHPIRTRSIADLHHRALARGFASHEYGQACYPKIKLGSEDEKPDGGTLSWSIWTASLGWVELGIEAGARPRFSGPLLGFAAWLAQVYCHRTCGSKAADASCKARLR
jgi:hypothetical protein